MLNLALSMKNQNNWLKEISEDLNEIGLREETIQDRTKFRTVIHKHKFSEKPTRQNAGWTEQRKREHSERMKRYWEERKNKSANKFKRAP